MASKLACEICGSLEAVRDYRIEGDRFPSVLCEAHALGIDAKAERVYWRRRRSSSPSGCGESLSKESKSEVYGK
jgi:hypothetical protein